MPSIPTRLLDLLLLGLSIAVVALLVGLSIYNHASPVDDYCFADTARTYGYWKAQHFYYHGWSGRYFHNLIVHASPLAIGWQGGYKLVPLVMLALLVHAFYKLGRVLAPANWLTPWRFVAAALVLFIATLPSIAEFFFWVPGIGCYSLSCSLLILWLIRAYRRDQGQLQGTVASMMIDGLLIAAIVGSSETATAALLSWVALITLGKWLQAGDFKKIPTYVWVYWVVALVSAAFLFGAPGNAIRMNTGPVQRDAVALVKQSIQFTVQFVSYRLWHTPLLPLSLLFLPAAYRLTAPQHPFYIYTRLPLGLGVLHMLATVWFLLFMHFWAVAIPPPLRLQNVANLMGLLSWFYCLTVLVRWLRPSVERFRLNTFNPALTGAGMLGLVIMLWPNPVIRMMIADLKTGQAKQYSDAMDARYVQLQQSTTDTVRHAPLPVLPASLVVEDIRTDPKHLWNKCWASYYHRKAVVLTK